MIVNSFSDIYKDDSSLRPYQQKAKKEIFESWNEVDNVMFQMPTGTGKTRLFTSIIRDVNEYSVLRREPVKILIIAHRTELIDQIDESLTKYRVPHNVIAGGRDRDYKYPVNVASIQTITHPNNLKDAKKLDVQFVIIDEAHHALATTYKKLWNLYPGSKKLGVTATPWRMNHQSFLDLFDKLVLSMPIKDFIKQGYLAPYKYFSLRSNSDIQRTIDDIELDRFGEYKESSMEEKMDIGSIRAQLLDSYLSLADGKKGIIYAINIVHAKHICEEYKKAGYVAVSIDSKTPAAERKEQVAKFKKGLIDIIVNVDIFSEGFDCPDIEFIQLARPTRSLVKYLQQVGRGLRPTENKQECIILDNVGMYSRFGLPDAKRYWNHHFEGHDVVEEPGKPHSRGTGFSRQVDMSEGTEDMELIQDTYEDVANETDNNEITNKEEVFNPIQLLKSYNFNCDNFIFNFTQSKRIFETYIQDDKYFIISELIIDKDNQCVHRKRVGRIPSDSWMFWQMLREKIDNLKSITHYGANFTVFHYRVLSSETKTPKDKFFDYKGREIDSPDVVIKKYEQAITEGGIHDYIDMPVSKASFKVILHNSCYTLYRTVNDKTKPIAKMENTSNFGFSYEFDVALDNDVRKSKGLPQMRLHNTDRICVIRSDDYSFTIKKVEKGKGYLLKYNLDGQLLQTSTISSITEIKTDLLKSEDIEKLKHSFDKKSTSYKYFWLMSVLQIYKETQVTNISYRQILIRMVANSWKYVYLLNGQFPLSDQLPKYLSVVQNNTKLHNDSTVLEIESELNKNFETLKSESQFISLLKNVPYRFLSPWIPFTSNDEVIKRSQSQESRCPYELYSDHIVVSELWKKTLLDYYDTIMLFAEYGLESFLKIDQNDKEAHDFYNTRFVTLNQLLKGIERRRRNKDVQLFLSKFNFPPSGKIVPTDLIEKMPESQCVIDRDGHKRVNIPGELWSLKIVDKLLSGETLIDTYDDVHLLSDYGLKAFQKNSQKEIKDIHNKRFSSLSALLKEIKNNKDEKAVKEFLSKFGFPSSGEIKPTDIIKLMPESKCVIDSDGRKKFDVHGEMWSLKALSKLLGE